MSSRKRIYWKRWRYTEIQVINWHIKHIRSNVLKLYWHITMTLETLETILINQSDNIGKFFSFIHLFNLGNEAHKTTQSHKSTRLTHKKTTETINY